MNVIKELHSINILCYEDNLRTSRSNRKATVNSCFEVLQETNFRDSIKTLEYHWCIETEGEY